MYDNKLLKKADLGELFKALRAANRTILAPVAKGEQILFEEVSSPEEMTTDYIQTTVSAKGTVFPRCEELFRYENKAGEVELKESAPEPPETVLFGVRPCDAASFDVLNSVFSWEPKDELFARRRERLTVIGMGCVKADQYCFCTSVGTGPGDTKGSDILLTPLASGDYFAEVVTAKGQSLVEMVPQLFSASGDAKKTGLVEVPVKFEVEVLGKKLPIQFAKDELWMEQSLRCLGCGACAFVCPTCVCFDIQDEKKGQSSGVRLRCWDSCGLSLFTLHTSGHNPRNKQSARWRQRVMHKFSYFPERLKFLGCVGCGRCSRACPADMEFSEHLKTLAEAE